MKEIEQETLLGSLLGSGPAVGFQVTEDITV